jgi:uncharacterized RDD family membrane protein YckC
LQCGAVLPSSVPVCHFCESSFTADFSSEERVSGTSPRRDPPPNFNSALKGDDRRSVRDSSEPLPPQEPTWRGELAQRLDAHRTRRRKLAPTVGQSKFSFEAPPQKAISGSSAAVAESPVSDASDFSFTIAIGRPSQKRVQEEACMVIDVSQPSQADTESHLQAQLGQTLPQLGLYPVASIDDRRLAGLIDLGCLLFAYGGFLMLFNSLGWQFTMSKLTAVVYITTFAMVYLQYFSLFTIFGGTTPGMMLRNLQVTSFSGEPPAPRQMLLRSMGYMLSAATFFLGFLWSMWDEDQLTWHDRLSRTYLSTAQTFADLQTSSVTPGR